MQALAASLAVEVRLWQVVGWLVVCEGLTKRSDYGTPWCVLCEACWSACCSEWEEEWETGFLPEVRFQGGALVRAADKGEPVGWGGDLESSSEGKKGREAPGRSTGKGSGPQATPRKPTRRAAPDPRDPRAPREQVHRPSGAGAVRSQLLKFWASFCCKSGFFRQKAELFGSNRVRRAALERSIGQSFRRPAGPAGPAGPARGAGRAHQAASGRHRGRSKNGRTASDTAPRLFFPSLTRTWNAFFGGGRRRFYRAATAPPIGRGI